MTLSTDIDLLNEICRRELIGRVILKIRWAFAERLNLYFDSPIGTRVALYLGPIEWTLVDISTNQNLISTKKQSFDVYSLAVEQLMGATIVGFTVSASNDLSLSLDFDTGMRLRTEPCGSGPEDNLDDCWSLSCQDDNVIIVGAQQGRWGRIHKDQSWGDILKG